MSRVNPDELVELRNHGSMKLRSAVARAMLLLPAERNKATIVRNSEPSVLRFKAIKLLSQALEGLYRSKRSKPSSSERSHSMSRSQGRKTSSRSRVA
jgi:hypothetical protein